MLLCCVVDVAGEMRARTGLDGRVILAHLGIRSVDAVVSPGRSLSAVLQVCTHAWKIQVSTRLHMHVHAVIPSACLVLRKRYPTAEQGKHILRISLPSCPRASTPQRGFVPGGQSFSR